MKTLQIFLVVFFVLLAMPSLFAQIEKDPGKKAQQAVERTGGSGATAGVAATAASVGLTQGTSLKGLESSMYVGDNWPEGELRLRNGKLLDSYRFRYDVYADQMQFTDGRDTLAFASPAELSTVTFDGHTFVYEPFECTGMLMKGYFEQLVQGKNRLLLKRTVTYHVPEQAQEAADADKYFVTECYFFKKPDKPAVKVMCSKKSAMSVMCEHNEEMDAYLKKTGNKVRTREDLEKMVEYYNSLE